MKAPQLLPLVIVSLCAGTLCLAAADPEKSVTVRVAAYNVEYGKNTSPEQVGKMFKPYKLDIIGFNEVPDGDWTMPLPKVLGLSLMVLVTLSTCSAVILVVRSYQLHQPYTGPR